MSRENRERRSGKNMEKAPDRVKTKAME